MFIQRLLPSLFLLLLVDVAFGAETPTKATRSKFETPSSSDRRAEKKRRSLDYDNMSIPLGFDRIVNYFGDYEPQQNQLKFLAAELWDPSNLRAPSTALTGSLAMGFWFCTYKSEEECYEFLDSRKPNDIDILVDDLTTIARLLPCNFEQRSIVDRGEKSVRYKNCDEGLFDYDFILMGANGLDFGSINDLSKNSNQSYIPVLSINKLRKQKKSMNSEMRNSRDKEDVDILKDLLDYAPENKKEETKAAPIKFKSDNVIQKLNFGNDDDDDNSGWVLKPFARR